MQLMRSTILVAAGLALALGGCAKNIPVHDGYESDNAKPWKKPRPLEFDEDREAEADGTVDYAARKRARWYVIELPVDAELNIRLRFRELLDIGETDENEDLDLAFEVLDSDYRVLMRADKEEPDAGDKKKDRTLYELRAGTYFIHIWAQERLDEAEFNLRLKWNPMVIEELTNFPAEVAFVGELPQVPLFDDAPPPKKPRCRGRRCRRHNNNNVRKPPPPKEDDEPETGEMVQGRIVGATATSGGTRITVNRGSAHGIANGFKGAVINKSGKTIPNGTFTVTKVTASESFGVVRVAPDALSSAAGVVLKP